MLTIGQPLPAITVSSTNYPALDLTDFRGKHIILYFYPRDNTPGCTNQALAFNQHLDQFKALNTVILGVSRDSLASHRKFTDKYQLKFELISDAEEQLCQAFDVIKNKKLYGKTFLGIERATFHINPEGILTHEWRKVSVKQHIETVLSYLQQLP